MPRILSEKDLAMLRKLAPECGDLVCIGSGVPFRSLLPPVANHFAAGPADFDDRLGCVPPAYADVLIARIAARLGPGTAGRVLGIYEADAGCEDGGPE